jgi:hypothetical protein
MIINIFYSWQSDTNNKINRNFIEDALKKAIEKLKKDIELNLAERDFLLDKDTKNVAGTPPIAETIFNKIDKAAVFIPDLTFIGESKTEEKKLLSNPNVLIEYGWALKQHGHSKMLPIMNTHFGNSKNNLPFDMNHLRHPICYNLSPKDGEDKRKEIKKQLSEELFQALKLILGQIPATEHVALPREIAPSKEPALFHDKDEDLGKRAEVQLYMPATARGFLRLLPTMHTKHITSSFQAIELVKKGQLQIFGRNSSANYIRNKFGALVVDNEPNGEIIKMTQLHLNNELWGIDNYGFSKKSSEYDFGYIPCSYLEEVFNLTLNNYLNFYKKFLNIPNPLKFIAGLVNIKDYKMTAPSGMGFNHGLDKFGGYTVNENIVYEGTIEGNNNNSSIILRPFYEKVWEECGIKRPDKQIL